MAALATPRQIGAIRTLAAKAGMDEDTYRDFLDREAKVRSARQLSLAAAGHVIDKLKDMVGAPALAKGAVAGLNSPVARKLQALWIAGWNLGLIRDRTDRAMLAFLERQTGVSHTRFLSHPSDATSAIEALKDWLARAGGVVWPNDRRDDGGDVLAHKWAVLFAQWAKFTGQDLSDLRKEEIASFAFKIIGKDWRGFDSRDLDQVQAALGRKLRAAMERPA